MANFNPCCCLSLKIGSLLIAILEIVLNLVVTGFTTATIITLASIHTEQNNVSMQQVKEKVQRAHPEMRDEEPEAIFEMLYIVLGLTCVLCVFQVIFASVLIHGIRQERLRLLKSWIIFKASCIVFSVIFTIAVAITQERSKTYGEISMDVISILLGQYFLFVVYQLYREIWTNSQNQQRPRPMNKSPGSKYEYYG